MPLEGPASCQPASLHSELEAKKPSLPTTGGTVPTLSKGPGHSSTRPNLVSLPYYVHYIICSCRRSSAPWYLCKAWLAPSVPRDFPTWKKILIQPYGRDIHLDVSNTSQHSTPNETGPVQHTTTTPTSISSWHFSRYLLATREVCLYKKERKTKSQKTHQLQQEPGQRKSTLILIITHALLPVTTLRPHHGAERNQRLPSTIRSLDTNTHTTRHPHCACEFTVGIATGSSVTRLDTEYTHACQRGRGFSATRCTTYTLPCPPPFKTTHASAWSRIVEGRWLVVRAWRYPVVRVPMTLMSLQLFSRPSRRLLSQLPAPPISHRPPILFSFGSRTPNSPPGCSI